MHCSRGLGFASSGSSRPGRRRRPASGTTSLRTSGSSCIEGAAGLLVEGEAEQHLGPGDFVFLPARKRHRVTFTAADEPTVWLAVHFGVGV